MTRASDRFSAIGRRRSWLLAGAGAASIAALLAVQVRGIGPAPDARTVAVQKWLDTPNAVASTWRQVSDRTGDRYTAQVQGVGLVQMDAASGEVDEVIYDTTLISGAMRVTLADAQGPAIAFATRHYNGFGALSLRSAELVDHGSFKEYRYHWQARSGDAWLPSAVTVGINPTSGAVEYYWSSRVSVRASVTPQVSRDQAAASVRQLLHLTSFTNLSPVLSLEPLPDGSQALVWISEIHGQVVRAGLIQYSVVWTDAHTGLSRVTGEG